MAAGAEACHPVPVPEERLIDDRPPTGLLEEFGSTPPGQRMLAVIGARGTRRRRRSIVLAVVLLVLLGGGLATGLTLRHLDRQYGPLEPGSFWGAYSDEGFDFHEKGGFRFRLQDAPDATGQLIAAIRNDGAHSVRITSIEPDLVTSKIQWSSYRVVNQGSVFGEDMPWHTFPAVVPAHGTIRVLVTIRHPDNCSAYPEIGGVRQVGYGATHWVRWESLLHSHRTLVELWNNDFADDVGVC